MYGELPPYIRYDLSAGVFIAISAALVALSTSKDLPEIPPLIQILAPIPIIFWYFGIFRPMDNYGQLRSKRLGIIEELLNNGIPDLYMCHFIEYNYDRNKPKNLFEKLNHPRVHEFVAFFGILISIIEIYIVSVHLLIPGLLT